MCLTAQRHPAARLEIVQTSDQALPKVGTSDMITDGGDHFSEFAVFLARTQVHLFVKLAPGSHSPTHKSLESKLGGVYTHALLLGANSNLKKRVAVIDPSVHMFDRQAPSGRQARR